MKRLLCIILLLPLGVFAQEKINWMTWEEAVSANAKSPKKIFVDIYTDWCGWCKKMDQTTFKDKDVIKYMNENYYCVKMDAESKTPIKYKGKTYGFKKFNNKGYNSFALALLGNKLTFPAFVTLKSNEQIEYKMFGYLNRNQLLTQLKNLNK